MNSDLLVAASWFAGEAGPGNRSEHALWFGEGELVRFVASQPLHSIPEVNWEQFPDRHVLVMQRARRELP
jgi:hypothetical protein